MGKRKERRLAAMNAAGRRVKLDLFAEPSGEMVGMSSHDEVGEVLDQDHHAGVPISPSSSGQRQENPLLLLGQYSDDELEEDVNNQSDDAANGSSSTDLDGQVQEPVDPGVEVGSNSVKVTTAGSDKQEPDKVDTVKKLDSNDVKEIDVTPEPPPCSEAADLPTQICVPEASEMQVDGDISGGWKMVLHEQSNRYYYWNTVTGETSWEIPSVLAVDTQVAGEQNITSATGENTSMHFNTDSVAYAYVAAVDGSSSGNPVSNNATDYGSVLEIGKENGEVVQLAYDPNQSLTHYSTGVARMSYHGASALPDYVSLEQTKNDLSVQLRTPLEEHHVLRDEYKDKHFTDPSDSYEQTEAHSARLVKYCENLLQQLKALDRSGYHLEGHEWIIKEIEIRLSDCRALSSYGPSLLPFWWHTETQLKQLESAISKEASLLHSKGNNEIEARPQKSSPRNELDLQNAAGSEVSEKEKDILFTVENNNGSSLSNGPSKVQSEASSQMPDSEDVKLQIISSGSTYQHLEGEQENEVVLETSPSTVPVHLVHNVEPHVEEDIDMDVEMEVDEETPAGQTAEDIPSSVCPAPLGELIQPIPSSSERPAVPLDESSVPPPPEEEWIPPPPPDSEPVPPPPPEEPATPLPPPYADTMLCPPYQDHYNLGYTVPTYEYYAPTVSEVANGNYYAHAEGSHVVEPQPPAYYEPVVTGVFPEGPVDVNIAEPVSYYDVSTAPIPPVPVVSSIESTGFYVESGPISYNPIVSASDQTTSVGFAMEPSVYGVAREYETGVLQTHSVSSAAQAAEAASVSGSTSDALPSANPKNRSKVVRSKKRTIAVAPTLRSNKKVSSLVDKWKAAKEELHGEEDEEPEDPNEILEKKRQKEIEKWRARQIASGEAQENANFLPLGGDWRERVKRKRAAAKAEAETSSSHAVEEEKQQPDLVQLSKDLPSGWQVYWDESTKQVYYGNSITSETSWTRPTR